MVNKCKIEPDVKLASGLDEVITQTVDELQQEINQGSAVLDSSRATVKDFGVSKTDQRKYGRSIKKLLDAANSTKYPKFALQRMLDNGALRESLKNEQKEKGMLRRLASSNRGQVFLGLAGLLVAGAPAYGLPLTYFASPSIFTTLTSHVGPFMYGSYAESMFRLGVAISLIQGGDQDTYYARKKDAFVSFFLPLESRVAGGAKDYHDSIQNAHAETESTTARLLAMDAEEAKGNMIVMLEQGTASTQTSSAFLHAIVMQDTEGESILQDIAREVAYETMGTEATNRQVNDFVVGYVNNISSIVANHKVARDVKLGTKDGFNYVNKSWSPFSEQNIEMYNKGLVAKIKDKKNKRLPLTSAEIELLESETANESKLKELVKVFEEKALERLKSEEFGDRVVNTINRLKRDAVRGQASRNLENFISEIGHNLVGQSSTGKKGKVYLDEIYDNTILSAYADSEFLTAVVRAGQRVENKYKDTSFEYYDKHRQNSWLEEELPNGSLEEQARYVMNNQDKMKIRLNIENKGYAVSTALKNGARAVVDDNNTIKKVVLSNEYKTRQYEGFELESNFTEEIELKIKSEEAGEINSLFDLELGQTRRMDLDYFKKLYELFPAEDSMDVKRDYISRHVYGVEWALLEQIETPARDEVEAYATTPEGLLSSRYISDHSYISNGEVFDRSAAIRDTSSSAKQLGDVQDRFATMQKVFEKRGTDEEPQVYFGTAEGATYVNLYKKTGAGMIVPIFHADRVPTEDISTPIGLEEAGYLTVGAPVVLNDGTEKTLYVNKSGKGLMEDLMFAKPEEAIVQADEAKNKIAITVSEDGVVYKDDVIIGKTAALSDIFSSTNEALKTARDLAAQSGQILYMEISENNNHMTEETKRMLYNYKKEWMEEVGKAAEGVIGRPLEETELNEMFVQYFMPRMVAADAENATYGLLFPGEKAITQMNKQGSSNDHFNLQNEADASNQSIVNDDSGTLTKSKSVHDFVAGLSNHTEYSVIDHGRLAADPLMWGAHNLTSAHKSSADTWIKLALFDMIRKGLVFEVQGATQAQKEFAKERGLSQVMIAQIDNAQEVVDRQLREVEEKRAETVKQWEKQQEKLAKSRATLIKQTKNKLFKEKALVAKGVQASSLEGDVVDVYIPMNRRGSVTGLFGTGSNAPYIMEDGVKVPQPDIFDARIFEPGARVQLLGGKVAVTGKNGTAYYDTDIEPGTTWEEEYDKQDADIEDLIISYTEDLDSADSVNADRVNPNTEAAASLAARTYYNLNKSVNNIFEDSHKSSRAYNRATKRTIARNEVNVGKSQEFVEHATENINVTLRNLQQLNTAIGKGEEVQIIDKYLKDALSGFTEPFLESFKTLRKDFNDIADNMSVEKARDIQANLKRLARVVNVIQKSDGTENNILNTVENDISKREGKYGAMLDNIDRYLEDPDVEIIPVNIAQDFGPDSRIISYDVAYVPIVMNEGIFSDEIINLRTGERKKIGTTTIEDQIAQTLKTGYRQVMLTAAPNVRIDADKIMSEDFSSVPREDLTDVMKQLEYESKAMYVQQFKKHLMSVMEDYSTIADAKIGAIYSIEQQIRAMKSASPEVVRGLAEVEARYGELKPRIKSIRDVVVTNNQVFKEETDNIIRDNKEIEKSFKEGEKRLRIGYRSGKKMLRVEKDWQGIVSQQKVFLRDKQDMAEITDELGRLDAVLVGMGNLSRSNNADIDLLNQVHTAISTNALGGSQAENFNVKTYYMRADVAAMLQLQTAYDQGDRQRIMEENVDRFARKVKDAFTPKNPIVRSILNKVRDSLGFMFTGAKTQLGNMMNTGIFTFGSKITNGMVMRYTGLKDQEDEMIDVLGKDGWNRITNTVTREASYSAVQTPSQSFMRAQRNKNSEFDSRTNSEFAIDKRKGVVSEVLGKKNNMKFGTRDSNMELSTRMDRLRYGYGQNPVQKIGELVQGNTELIKEQRRYQQEAADKQSKAFRAGSFLRLATINQQIDNRVRQNNYASQNVMSKNIVLDHISAHLNNRTYVSALAEFARDEFDMEVTGQQMKDMLKSNDPEVSSEAAKVNRVFMAHLMQEEGIKSGAINTLNLADGRTNTYLEVNSMSAFERIVRSASQLDSNIRATSFFVRHVEQMFILADAFSVAIDSDDGFSSAEKKRARAIIMRTIVMRLLFMLAAWGVDKLTEELWDAASKSNNTATLAAIRDARSLWNNALDTGLFEEMLIAHLYLKYTKGDYVANSFTPKTRVQMVTTGGFVAETARSVAGRYGTPMRQGAEIANMFYIEATGRSSAEQKKVDGKKVPLSHAFNLFPSDTANQLAGGSIESFLNIVGLKDDAIDGGWFNQDWAGNWDEPFTFKGDDGEEYEVVRGSELGFRSMFSGPQVVDSKGRVQNFREIIDNIKTGEVSQILKDMQKAKEQLDAKEINDRQYKSKVAGLNSRLRAYDIYTDEEKEAYIRQYGGPTSSIKRVGSKSSKSSRRTTGRGGSKSSGSSRSSSSRTSSRVRRV